MHIYFTRRLKRQGKSLIWISRRVLCPHNTVYVHTIKSWNYFMVWILLYLTCFYCCLIIGVVGGQHPTPPCNLNCDFIWILFIGNHIFLAIPVQRCSIYGICFCKLFYCLSFLLKIPNLKRKNPVKKGFNLLV